MSPLLQDEFLMHTLNLHQIISCNLKTEGNIHKTWGGWGVANPLNI